MEFLLSNWQKLCSSVVRKMMAELFPSLEQELTNFEVFGIQIDTTYVEAVIGRR